MYLRKGPVKSIRILADKETGKPKGFAFVEYFDTNAALSAIRHLDQTELNGRKIKVGYPAQRYMLHINCMVESVLHVIFSPFHSNLKDIARQIGHVVPESSADSSGLMYASNVSQLLCMTASSRYILGSTALSRSQIEQNIISSMRLHEIWDLIDAMTEDNTRGRFYR